MEGFKQSITPEEIKLIDNLCGKIQQFTLKEMIFYNVSQLPNYSQSRQLYLWSEVETGGDLTDQDKKKVADIVLKVSQMSYNALYQLSQSMIYMFGQGFGKFGIGVIPPPIPCEET